MLTYSPAVLRSPGKSVSCWRSADV